MTTIAADQEQMAGDTLISDGTTRCYGTKIFRLKSGSIIGYAGSVSDGLRWVAWMKAGRPAEDCPDVEDFEGLELTARGRLVAYDSELVPQPLTSKRYAAGSGKDAALAAMIHGATPKEAVKTAAKVTIGTGGRITCLERK